MDPPSTPPPGDRRIPTGVNPYPTPQYRGEALDSVSPESGPKTPSPTSPPVSYTISPDDTITNPYRDLNINTNPFPTGSNPFNLTPSRSSNPNPIRSNPYIPTASTRRPRTDNLPPETEDPGPLPPVPIDQTTDPAAYYISAVSGGASPRQAVYIPRDARGVRGGLRFDPSSEATPDAVVALRMAASVPEGTDMRGLSGVGGVDDGESMGYGMSREDVKVVVEWYEEQIRRMFKGQMDAMANMYKEWAGHGETKDTFAFVFEQVKKEVEDKENLREIVEELEGAIARKDEDIDWVRAGYAEEQEKLQRAIRDKDRSIQNLSGELRKQRELQDAATTAAESTQNDNYENTKKALLILQKNWETQLELVKGQEETIGALKEQLTEVTLQAEEAQTHAIAAQESFGETSAGNDELKRELASHERTAEALRKKLRDELYQSKVMEQMSETNEALTTTVTRLEAELQVYKKSNEELDGVDYFVEDLLKTHREKTGSPGHQREAPSVALSNHREFIKHITTEIRPKFGPGRAIGHIVSAQIAFAKKQYIDALEFLEKAEREIEKVRDPESRAMGRMCYWRGRVYFAQDDQYRAVTSLEEAFRIERLPSSKGSLYEKPAVGDVGGEDEQDEKDFRAKGEEDDFRAKSKSLDVSGWLKKARDAFRASSPA